MAGIQTEIRFAVRKNRYCSSKVKSEKENAFTDNVEISRKPISTNNEKLKKKIDASENLLNGDSDSDNECSTVKRSTRCVKRFVVSDHEDESGDEVENTLPPKRGRILRSTPMKDDTSSPFKLRQDSSSPSTGGKRVPHKQLFVSDEIENTLPGRILRSTPVKNDTSSPHKLHQTNSPSTGGKRLPHKQLFESDEIENILPSKRGRILRSTPVKNETSSPNKLHQASSPSTGGKRVPHKQLFVSDSKYQQVRQALQASHGVSMTDREEQMHQLRTILEDRLSSCKSETLYISGPPGTGKTACLSKIMEESKVKNNYKMVSVNCTSMKSSGMIYKRIAQDLSLKINKQTEKECLLSIERYLVSNHKMILLVLDEIDQLDSRKQSVLYTIFEWPSKPNSKLVLIGIANALDLTDRILPRLQARLDLKPTLLHFPPYSKSQIVNILTERIKQSDACDIFPRVALELLAGKVASTCGDIRRALDIARRVVEIAEVQRSDQSLPLQPTVSYGNRLSPSKSSQKREMLPCSPRKSPRKHANVGCITVKDVMTVMNSVYGVSQSLAADCDESFPLQQKILVATLLLVIKKGNSKDVTVGKLHEAYCRVCQKKNLLAVDQSEFISLCKLVETRGILRVQERKDTRLSKVCLQWDEEEVSSALKDKQLLSSILHDTSCLS